MYQVVFGNRRLAAAQKLGWKTIAAEVVGASDAETLLMAFSENIDRRDFSDYEKAILLQRLHETTGKNYTEIASYIGRSTAFVSQHVAMLHLFPKGIAPEDEMSKVLHSLSEGHARIIARINDNQERWNTAKLVVSANLGVRELEREFRRSLKEEDASRIDDQGTWENSANPSSRQKLHDIVSNIIDALNSKDIRPAIEIASSDHFSMFPGFSSLSSVVNSSNLEEYLFEVLRKTSSLKLGKPKYVDVRFYGNVAYVALVTQDEIIAPQKKQIKTSCRATIIFEKQSGKWKMVHSHWSIATPPSEIDKMFAIDIESKARQRYR